MARCETEEKSENSFSTASNNGRPPLKICRVVQGLPTSHGAGGLHTLYLIKHIQQPTLVLTKGGDEKWAAFKHATIKRINYSQVSFSIFLGSQLYEDGKRSLRQRLQIAYRLLLKTKELVFFFKTIPSLIRFRPDIVHVHSLITLHSGIFAKLFLRCRVVITLHNVTEAMLIKKSRILRLLLRIPDRVLCVSRAIHAELRDVIPPSRLAVTPSGVDLSVFRRLDLERKDQVIAVGVFKWQKGYPYLVQTMAKISRQVPTCKLVIAGEGPERGRIEQEIERLGLTDKIELLGKVPHEQIVRLLNESKLLVMSSLVEGLPKVLLESFACGTPAVVTTACNAEGIIEDAGLVVPPKDPHALAEAIGRILADEELWKKLSQGAMEAAKNHSWEIIARQVEDIYQEITVPSPARREKGDPCAFSS